MVRNLSPLLQCTGRKELLLVNLACFNHADQHLIWFEETSTASNFKIDQVQDNNQLTDDVAQWSSRKMFEVWTNIRFRDYYSASWDASPTLFSAPSFVIK